MRQISFFLLLLFINSSALFSQTNKSSNDTIVRHIKKEVHRYIPFSTGISALSARDYANSPLLYFNSGFYTYTGWLGLRKKSINILRLSLSGGSLYTQNNDEKRNYNLRTDFAYTYMYRCMYDWTTDTKIFVGGTISSLGNFRANPEIVNSNFTYEWFSSLEITSRIQKRFIFNNEQLPFNIDFLHKPKEMRIEFQLSVPVISYGVRPNYIAVPDIVDSEYNNFTFDNAGIFSFNNYYRINTIIDISYVMTNDNMLIVSYLWDFYSYYKDYNNVKASMKAVTLTFLFNIK